MTHRDETSTMASQPETFTMTSRLSARSDIDRLKAAILDCVCGAIADPGDLQRRLDGTVGVVEHGLFLGFPSRVIVGGSEGVRVLP